MLKTPQQLHTKADFHIIAISDCYNPSAVLLLRHEIEWTLLVVTAGLECFSFKNVRQFPDIFRKLPNLLSWMFDWPTDHPQIIFKFFILCYLYNIKRYRVDRPKSRFILPHTLSPYLFLLADQVTTMAQTHTKMFPTMLCLLFLPPVTFCATAGKKSGSRFRFKSRQSDLSGFQISVVKPKENQLGLAWINLFKTRDRQNTHEYTACKEYAWRLIKTIREILM